MTDRLPRAVREASQRADDLHKEAYDAKVPSEQQKPDEPQADAPVAPATVSDPAVVAADAGDRGAPPTESTEGPQPAPAPQVTPGVTPEETLDFWKNKFRTLEGKYRSEVPRYASQVREQNSRIQHLENTLATMAAAPPQNDGGTPTKSLVTPEEVEEYGEDFVSMMRRLAQEEAGRAVQQVAPKIQEVEGRLQQNLAQTQSDRVYTQLDAEVENWRDVNKSREFLAWLSEDDLYAGTTRAVMLRDAFDQKDGPRVVSFFNGFLSERKLVAPPPPSPPPQTPPAREPQVNLADLAGPRGGNGAGTPTAAPDGPIPWTRRQIAAFYKDVQMGVYKADPQKRDQIERSMHRALAAGLITP